MVTIPIIWKGGSKSTGTFAEAEPTFSLNSRFDLAAEGNGLKGPAALRKTGERESEEGRGNGKTKVGRNGVACSR